MNNKKILITGAQGLVGSRFVELHEDKDNLLTPSLDEFDFLNKELMARYIQNKNVGTVVNFAAYTDVGSAEKERNDKNGMCWKVNVEGVRNLSELFDPKSIHFIHISTDMVFTGSGEDPGPYDENKEVCENPDDLSWYGFTKGEGERIIKSRFNDKTTILRLIYPVRSKYPIKLDYLRKPLSLYDEGKLYPMFNNQQISVSFIDEISVALEKIISGNFYGIYHSGSEDLTTPYEIVSYLIEKARGIKNAVKPQTLEEFIENTGSLPVRYPKYGGLSVKITEEKLSIKYSSWREIVDKLLYQGID